MRTFHLKKMISIIPKKARPVASHCERDGMKPIKTTRKKIKRPTACLVFFFARLSKQNTKKGEQREIIYFSQISYDMKMMIIII
jgi:hypothetical protein